MSAAFPGTLDELAALLDRVATATDVFGLDVERAYCRLVKFCHPDLFPPGPLQDRAARDIRRLTEHRQPAQPALAPQVLLSPARQYRLVRQLAAGDLADVHLAVADGADYVIKITRPAGGNPLMAAEARHLKLLTTRCGDRRYREYLPGLVETFTVPGTEGDRQANVFVHREGFLFAAPRMRPQDAWDLHEEFDELLVRLFGPPEYHRLVMA